MAVADHSHRLAGTPKRSTLSVKARTLFAALSRRALDREPSVAGWYRRAGVSSGRVTLASRGGADTI